MKPEHAVILQGTSSTSLGFHPKQMVGGGMVLGEAICLTTFSELLNGGSTSSSLSSFSSSLSAVRLSPAPTAPSL